MQVSMLNVIYNLWPAMNIDTGPQWTLILIYSYIENVFFTKHLIKGITVFKIFIWGGISSDIRLEI